MKPQAPHRSIICAVGIFLVSIAYAGTINTSRFLDRKLSCCGIQKAIDHAAKNGGGTVKIPAGTYRLRRGLVLKDNVHLVGAGMDKTILIPFRKTYRMNPTAPGPDANGVCKVDTIPEELQVGCAVVLWRSFPSGHPGYQRTAYVAAVDRGAKTITIKSPYVKTNYVVPGKGAFSFGTCIALDKDVAKGATQIVVKNASMIQVGDELAIGEPGNDSRDRQVFVREVKGNTVILESPAQSSLKAWQGSGWLCINRMVWGLFPAIHGWDVKSAGIRDLTIKGHPMEKIRPAISRYTLSGIHLFNAQKVTIERVAVREWPADGFSLQTGNGCLLSACEATGVLQNGYHPGTSLKTTIIERSLAESCGNGFYWCWSNQGHIIRDNRFVHNRGGGMTGLGVPNETHNTIERNLIAFNGGVGLGINGGKLNIIRNNTIENNSQNTPGKHPGIALYASQGNATQYTIEGNTIRDTQERPTQHVGIEERNNPKRNAIADENTIRNNKFSGHRKADVIRVGPNTIVQGKAKVL